MTCGDLQFWAESPPNTSCGCHDSPETNRIPLRGDHGQPGNKQEPGKGKKHPVTLMSLVTDPCLAGLSPRTRQAHGKDERTGDPGKGKEELLHWAGDATGEGRAALTLPISETSPKATGTDFKELISHLRFSAIETTGLRG